MNWPWESKDCLRPHPTSFKICYGHINLHFFLLPCPLSYAVSPTPDLCVRLPERRLVWRGQKSKCCLQKICFLGFRNTLKEERKAECILYRVKGRKRGKTGNTARQRVAVMLEQARPQWGMGEKQTFTGAGPWA